MIQQMQVFLMIRYFAKIEQTVCPDCGGRGETISEADKCKECKGKKVVKDKKILQVYIEQGMQHGQKITFAGESDEAVIHQKYLLINMYKARTRARRYYLRFE